MRCGKWTDCCAGRTWVVDVDIREVLRHDPARAADERGREEDRRWTVLDLIRTYLEQDVLEGMPVTRLTESGDAAGSGHQSATGQHLPAPGRRSDARGRVRDGALRGRHGGALRHAGRGRRSTDATPRADDSTRSNTSSGQNETRRCDLADGFDFLGYRFFRGSVIRARRVRQAQDTIREDTTDQRTSVEGDHRTAQCHAPRVVRVLQALSVRC